MLWLILALAACFGVIFVISGLFARPSVESGPSSVEQALNRTLYEEKLADLNAQNAAGEISNAQRQALELEFQRQFLLDNQALPAQAASTPRGRWLLVLCALALPVFAGLVYMSIGASAELQFKGLLDSRTDLLSGDSHSEGDIQAADAEILVRLHQLEKARPDKPVYPLLLARLYQQRGDFQAAVPYYRKVVSLLPQDGSLQGEYAQALFFAADNQMTPAVLAAAQTAHAIDPQDATALGLLGIAAYHDSRYGDAIGHWQQALSGLRPDSASRASLLAGINSARQKLAASGQGAQETVAASTASLQVDVSLADELDVPADTTVFVYARAWQGSPMPLAIKRLTRADLPTRITLDESLAMNPAFTLASAEQVELVARVSFAGSATAAPGDIEGKLGPVDPQDSQSPLKVVIGRKIP
ncbi:MAG: hypothetical protein VR73_01345 [Gammaproteobacteria bacterium BRH_c0]|nr:MAG: hypothetical protein VR73_01345 [Gammaproteobacteria bacterium BRH_c0]